MHRRNVYELHRKMGRMLCASAPFFYGTAEFWVHEKLRRTPEDSNRKCGQEVRDADVRQAKEVRADGKDENAADVAEILECGRRHDRRNETCAEKDCALDDADGEGGEDAAPPECGREQHDDDAVQDALGKENRRVIQKAVVHRADDGHRADADRQGGGDEPIDEMRVSAAARDAFQSRAERRHAVLDVEQLADDRAADEAREHHVHPTA